MSLVKISRAYPIVTYKEGVKVTINEQEKLRDMLELQDAINIVATSEEWKCCRTVEDFKKAILVESAELMNSFPWKWWKFMEADTQNAQIELVDLFHFALSIILLERGGVGGALESSELEGFMDAFNQLDVDVQREAVDYESVSSLILEMAGSFLRGDSEMGFRKLGTLSAEFFTFDQFYLLYVGKNVLNNIRQEYGYKKGNYKGLFGGVEDNVFLLRLVQGVEGKGELETEIRSMFDRLRRQG